MARPGLQKHPKFRRLVALLGVPVPHAVGYLECLWEVSYECGNPAIGDVLDVELAAQWPGERGKLCESLMNCGGDGRAGFIEQIDGGRYQVHDLFDHAPDYVLQRRNKEAERHIGKACDQCGAPFRSKETHARFCSDRCKSAFHRKQRDTQQHAPTRSDTDGNEALRVATRSDTQRHEPPAPARARAPAPAPTGEDPAPDVQPVLPFTPVASKIEEQAIELAQEFAFLGRQGTSPNAVQLAVPFMLDLLNAGVAHAIIIAEMKRGDRMISEHPGRLRDRLLPPKEKQRGSRTTDHGDFDPNRTDYPSAQPGKDAG